MNEKKFVFIILHYNTLNDTIKCINSILKYKEKYDVKIIVIDNGSANKSGIELKKIYKDNKDIIIKLLSRNLGFSAGNNIGYEIAKKELKADFIIMCNNDTYLLQNNFFKKIIDEYNDSNFAVLGPQILLKNNNINPICDEVPSIKLAKKQLLRFKIDYFLNKYYLIKFLNFIRNIKRKMFKKKSEGKRKDVNLRYENIVLHGCFLIFSNQYISKFQGLPSKTFLYREEELLFLELKRYNLKSVYNPNIKIFHSDDSATNSIASTSRDKAMFKDKHQINSTKILIDELKKNRKNFVTLFPRIENIHLIKDVGMIPYCMSKYYGYDSYIVLYKNKDYPYLKLNEFSYLKKMYFPLKLFNSNLNNILFLIKNSKKIDILHLYHITQKSTIISLFFYFFFNKKGLVYIHLDLGMNSNFEDLMNINGKGIKRFLKRIIYKKIFNKNKKRILYGVQDKNIENKIKNKFPFYQLKYIPNGFENIYSNEISQITKKEKCILYVGRMDNKQKRVDLLIKTFTEISNEIKDWKLKLIGEYSAEFRRLFDNYINSNIDIKDRIELFDSITDRKNYLQNIIKLLYFVCHQIMKVLVLY